MEESSADGNSPWKEVKIKKEAAEASDVPDDKYRLFIGGIGFGVQNSELLEYFEQFGEVLYAESHPTRGFGYVSFLDAESMKKVLDQGVHELLGRKIKPKVAKPKAMTQGADKELSPDLDVDGSQKEDANISSSVDRDASSNPFIPGNDLQNPWSTQHQAPSVSPTHTPHVSPLIPDPRSPTVATTPTFNAQFQIVTDFNWTPPQNPWRAQQLDPHFSYPHAPPAAPHFDNPRPSMVAPTPSSQSQSHIFTDFNWVPPVNNEPPPPGEGESPVGRRNWFTSGSTSGFHYGLNISPPSTPPPVTQPQPPTAFPDGPPPLPLPKERYIPDYADHDAPLPPPKPYPDHNQGATDPVFLQNVASSRLRQRYFNYVRTDSTNDEAGRPDRVYRTFLHPSTHPYSKP